jgi:hypothetical protein
MYGYLHERHFAPERACLYMQVHISTKEKTGKENKTRRSKIKFASLTPANALHIIIYFITSGMEMF